MLRFVTLLSFFVGSLIAAELHTGHSEDDLLQWRSPESEFVVKPADKKPKAPIVINTPHIPGNLGSLGLTTGELKLFSGHALNILKSKCPNVNHHTLFKLHKYIGKRITKDEPVQGANAKLRTLLDKMMECSSKVKTSPLNKELKSKVVGVDEAKSEEAAEFPPAGMVPVVSTLVVRIRNGVVQSTEKPAAPVLPAGSKPVGEKKKWTEMTPEEKTHELSSMLEHFEPQRKIPSTTTQEPTAAPPATTKAPRHPIVGWLSSIMDTVSQFFRNLFGFGSVRPRRATQFEASENSPYVLTVWKPEAGGSNEEKIGGRQAFLTLVDELCRIYCDTCSTNQAGDFKIAAKELLQYLFAEDNTGLDLAASHYLNHEFLQSVKECE